MRHEVAFPARAAESAQDLNEFVRAQTAATRGGLHGLMRASGPFSMFRFRLSGLRERLGVGGSKAQVRPLASRVYRLSLLARSGMVLSSRSKRPPGKTLPVLAEA